jgi:DNA-binding response OmpR family regulator
MVESTNIDSTDRLGARTVLYVDAEEARRQTVRTTLEAIGFAVLLAGDGREGVESFREHADEIRVVILDLDMPDRSGEKAIQEIRRLRPMSRVLLLSGESAEMVRPRFPGKGRVDVLQKPFQFVQLVEHIQAACGKRRYARLDVSLPVSAWVLEQPGAELRGRLLRVAEGGMEVELPEAVPPSTGLRVVMPTRRGPTEVEGKVVFARSMGPAVRHGLAFFQPKDFHFVLGLFVHDEKW